MHTYSSDVAFHLLPIGQLQAFRDFQEMSSFKEFFHDFKCTRDSGFSEKLLASLKDCGAEEHHDDLEIITLQGPGAFTVDVDSAISIPGDHGKTFGTYEYDEILNSRTTSPIDVRVSYRKNRSRFHEFMVAVLGMTVFDAAGIYFEITFR